jgi:hypothetical protein
MAEGSPCPRKKPTLQKFERQPTAVIHRPTGAAWTLRPNTIEVRSFKPGKLGLTLANGDVYAEDEVKRLAMILIQKPPQEAKDIEPEKRKRWRRDGYS